MLDICVMLTFLMIRTEFEIKEIFPAITKHGKTAPSFTSGNFVRVAFEFVKIFLKLCVVLSAVQLLS